MGKSNLGPVLVGGLSGRGGTWERGQEGEGKTTDSPSLSKKGC